MDKGNAMEVSEVMYGHLAAMVDECKVVDLRLTVKLLSGDVVDVSMVDRRPVGFGHNSVSILRAYTVGGYPNVGLKFDVRV